MQVSNTTLDLVFFQTTLVKLVFYWKSRHHKHPFTFFWVERSRVFLFVCFWLGGKHFFPTFILLHFMSIYLKDLGRISGLFSVFPLPKFWVWSSPHEVLKLHMKPWSSPQGLQKVRKPNKFALDIGTGTICCLSLQPKYISWGRFLQLMLPQLLE